MPHTCKLSTPNVNITDEANNQPYELQYYASKGRYMYMYMQMERGGLERGGLEKGVRDMPIFHPSAQDD